MEEVYWTSLLLLLLKLLTAEADHSVHILSKNLEQFITSTTLEWVPYNSNDHSQLTNAVIAAYQSVEEPKINEPGEYEMQDVSYEIVQKPVYICRATINSVWISGQLRPNKTACIVSLYKKVSEYKDFEILVNIEGSARLSWIYKNKYSFVSQGAVTSGENILRTFIARRSANSHNKEGSLTHIVGKCNPAVNFGVFYFVDQNNQELEYEDGEILVETEPVCYEFKSIKFERIKGRFSKSERKLGFAILKNEEDSLQRAAIMINYKYNYSVFWGKGHGLLTGLPFTVTLSNGTQVRGAWAVQKEEERSDVAPVEKYLEEGTAVNVTLIGNYTESEIPYESIVVAIYEDGEKREIMIKDTKRENTILDVVAVFSPVYFLHNNSHVPTTTTTTAATTSGTTSATTSKILPTTEEIAPIISPEIITTHKTVNSKDRERPHDNMVSDDENTHRHDSSTKKSAASTDPNGALSLGMFNLVTILSVALVILRVT